MPRLTSALALCLLAARAVAETPAPALSQVVIDNGDTQVILAAGGSTM